MKRHSASSILKAIGTGVALAVLAGTPVSAHEDGAANEVSMLNKKPKITIICNETNGVWGCQVRDKDGNPGTPSNKPPTNIVAVEPLAYIVEADVDPHGRNPQGPHCWVLIGGKYTQIHC